MTAETSIFDWRAERDAAMAQVAENAGPDFAKQFRAFVLEYLKTYTPSTGEELTTAAKAKGIVAHNDKATGPVIAALSREKLIMFCGIERRKKGHGSHGANLWALTRN